MKRRIKQTREQRHALAQLLVAQQWWLRYRNAATRAVMNYAAKNAWRLDAVVVYRTTNRTQTK